jgi:sugar lactone lactonase YvrE
MTFRVYPDPPERPLSVAAGATSAPVPIEELVGSGPGGATMFIRFAVIDADCTPPASPAPTVLLIADGSEFQVTSVDSVDPTPVAAGGAAFATIFPPGPAGRGVYRLDVFKQTTTPIAWQLRFRNNHTATQRLTWVVADQAAETRQPWIDLPEAASVEFTPGEPATTAIRAANLGTGPLTISDRAGSSPGPGFALTAVPAAISPNACADLQVSFTAPDTLATSAAAVYAAVYAATSNDTTAQQTPGHNRRVSLNATTRTGTIILLEQRGAGHIELFEVHPITGARTRLAFRTPFVLPTAVTVEADGNILVVDPELFGGAGGVVRVDPATGHQAKVSSGQMFVRPNGVAIEADNTIVVTDETAFDGKGGVIRVDLATGAQIALSRGGEVLVNPVAVAVEADGTILLLARTPDGAGGVFRVHPRTGGQTMLSVLSFSAAFGVAVEANGTILVARHVHGAGGGFTFSEGSVVRIEPNTGQQSTLTSGDSLHPVGLAVERDGRILIVDDGAFGPRGVIRVDPVSGQRTKLSPADTPGPQPPLSVTDRIAVLPAVRQPTSNRGK